MGIYLSSPVTTKRTEWGETGSRLSYSMSCMQGWRSNMEDTHVILPSLNINTLLNTSLFAIFDGHGGKLSSSYARDMLVSVLKEQMEFEAYEKLGTEEERNSPQGLLLLRKALKQCFIELDAKLFLKTSSASCTSIKGDSSGCTALVCIVTPKHVICANAGDSRAVMTRVEATPLEEEDSSKKLLVVPLSHDHRPTSKSEKERIKEAGGFIHANRVGGDLAVSRGLGDFRFKTNANPEEQIVTCVPEITIKDLLVEEDQFLLLGCDGLWEVDNKKEVISRVYSDLSKKSLEATCEDVLDLCLQKGSRDNMTAIICLLPAMMDKLKQQQLP